ncbi:hypothetical protein V1291_004566 [Nitrobacteraceae bacterium AZCC 1564]
MWVTLPYNVSAIHTWETLFPAKDACDLGACVMSNQRTIREQIECRDFETIALPQRICLGVAAFGGFALIALIIYCTAIMT